MQIPKAFEEVEKQLLQKAYDQYKTTTRIAEAWSDTITEKGYKQIFRVAPNNSMFSKRVVQFVEDVGYKNIAILAEDSDWGLQPKSLFLKNSTKIGGVSPPPLLRICRWRIEQGSALVVPFKIYDCSNNLQSGKIY
jgi:hypothetical protein